jgi:hypothetical protein
MVIPISIFALEVLFVGKQGLSYQSALGCLLIAG